MDNSTLTKAAQPTVFALELWNEDRREWVRVPNATFPSMTECLVFGMNMFEVLPARAVPVLH